MQFTFLITNILTHTIMYTKENTRIVRRILETSKGIYYAIPESEVHHQPLHWSEFADGSAMDEDESMDYSFKASRSGFLEDMIEKAGYDYDELCEYIEFQASGEDEECSAILLPDSEMTQDKFTEIIDNINKAAQGQSKITMIDALRWLDGEQLIGMVIDWEGSSFYSVNDEDVQLILDALNAAQQPICNEQKVNGYRIAKSDWCPMAIAIV